MFIFFFLFAALLEDFLVQDERNQVSNTSMEALTSKASISWSSPGISTESVDKDPGKWDEARSASIQKGHGCSLRWWKQSDNMVSGKWLWKWLLELIQLSLKRHIILIDFKGIRWVSNSPLKGLLEIPWTHGNQIVWQDAGILSQTLTSLAQASRAHWTVWEWGAWRVCDPEYVNV